jgi:hypothetical protein
LRDGNTLVLQLFAAGEYPVATGVYEYSVEDLKPRRAGGLDRSRACDHLYRRRLPPSTTPPLRAKLVISGCSLRRPGSDHQYGRVPIRDDVESRYGKILKQHKLLMTDVDLGQREVEVYETFRKLFR